MRLGTRNCCRSVTVPSSAILNASRFTFPFEALFPQTIASAYADVVPKSATAANDPTTKLRHLLTVVLMIPPCAINVQHAATSNRRAKPPAPGAFRYAKVGKEDRYRAPLLRFKLNRGRLSIDKMTIVRIEG